MNTRMTVALIAGKAALGGTLALGLLLAPHGAAHADPGPQWVNLSELPSIDAMPVCQQEDGSDVDPALLPCVWTDDGTGNAWLTFVDRSFLIVDDTAR